MKKTIFRDTILVLLLLLVAAGARAADPTEAITLKTMRDGTVVATIRYPRQSRRGNKMKLHADKIYRRGNKVTAIGNVVITQITQTRKGQHVSTIRVNRANITL